MQIALLNNNDEKITNLIKGLSQERLTKYARLIPNNLNGQIELYKWNNKLSETFYIPIQGLEIITRNYFHQVLTEQSHSWWTHVNFVHPQKNFIAQAIETLKEDNKSITSDNVVASLSFGFWTGLLSAKYENNLWRSCLYYSFKNISRPLLRKDVHREFNLIRMLRNRIAHHEPILRPDLANHYFRILRMINWFCKDTAAWIESQNSFIEAWHQPINPFLKSVETRFIASQLIDTTKN